MPWSYASSRLALILRRLRGRFGISAQRVAVRTHVPWRLRIVSIVIILGLLLVLAVWIFDFGRQIAGINQGEISNLESSKATLEEEVIRLRGLLAASDNNLQIEKAAQKVLTEKYRVLVEDNDRLKEELAVLERLSRNKRK